MSYFVTETKDDRNQPMMQEIGATLSEAYPGYNWHVRIDGGMLVIKNMSISDVWGMAVPYHKIAHDAGARKREVVMKAGEFLEAASLKRGASDGSMAKTLNGRLQRNPFQPIAPPLDVKIVH